jgi:hypothetical protein
MKLRVCDPGRERIVPASLELVERTFAPDASINDGTEITLAEGERWLAAIAIGAAGPRTSSFFPVRLVRLLPPRRDISPAASGGLCYAEPNLELSS